jgi:hypothetical protein
MDSILFAAIGTSCQVINFALDAETIKERFDEKNGRSIA